MASAATRQLLQPTHFINSKIQLLPPSQAVSQSLKFNNLPLHANHLSKSDAFSGHRILTIQANSFPDNIAGSLVDDDEGVSLGTMKLPPDTDFPRFETLLFQWANSLCQGANLPLPVPLKIDKITGGVRLGFVTMADGKTEVLVYIDCLVFPATATSGPMFRAIRNGALKGEPAPGEPRIMKSLLGALKKSVEIARV
ncbi:hypothetical protein Ancab_014287 [Ancistrocladus abbreviatus]